MANVIVKKSEKEGDGLFSKKDFKPNQKIVEIKGKLITCDVDDDLPKTVRDNAIRFDEDLFISPEGEFGNFINHSCNPNSYILKKGGKLFIFSSSKIKKGEEVSFDYSTIIGDDDSWVMTCFCREKTCRKKISKFSKLPTKTKAKYLSSKMVPNYIYEK